MSFGSIHQSYLLLSSEARNVAYTNGSKCTITSLIDGSVSRAIEFADTSNIRQHIPANLSPGDRQLVMAGAINVGPRRLLYIRTTSPYRMTVSWPDQALLVVRESWLPSSNVIVLRREEFHVHV